jgi:putative ABC transport system substrate-binding protein
MRRRECITSLGAAAVAMSLRPAATMAQARKVWRIGWLSTGSRPDSLESSQWGGFLQGMRELGYVEGRDFVMEWRFGEGRTTLLPALANELVRARVDVLLVGNSRAIRAAQEATSTIPIVGAEMTDPVGTGIIASLARPGGNVTGLANSIDDSTPKRVELLATLVPNLARVGLVWDSDNANSAPTFDHARASATTAGLQFVSVDTKHMQDLESVFATLVAARTEAILWTGTGLAGGAARQRVVEFVRRNRLPAIFSYREFVEAGGLMSYGESFRDFNRRAAFYVDKIIKGAKPADLPVQQPTRFFLTINRKTAEALGLSIPLALLVLADEIIE